VHIDRKDILVVAFLFVLSCLFFWKVLLNPGKMIYPALDIVFINSYWKHFITESFGAFGSLPLWTMLTQSGSTFVGNAQSALFYPPTFLFLFFGVDTLFGYLFLADVFLAGAFMYLFARAAELGKTASALSSIVYMFGGLLVSKVYMGSNMVADAIIWLPLVFFFFELALRKRSVAYGALGGIPLALSLLAGHLQYPAYILSALFLYFIFRCLPPARKKDYEALKLLALSFALLVFFGFALSAVQFLPFLEQFSSGAIRGASTDYGFATSMSLPPQQLLSLAIPEFFGTPLDNTYWGGQFFWELCAYVGIVPLLLAAFAVLFVKDRRVKFFALLAGLSVFFALGKYDPLYPLLYNFPLFSMFRGPGRMVFLYAFSAAVLAGFGCELLVKRFESVGKERLRLILKMLAVLAVVVLLSLLSVVALKSTILQTGEAAAADRIASSARPEVAAYYAEHVKEIAALAYDRILLGASTILFFVAAFASLLFLRMKNLVNARLFAMLLIILVLSDLWLFGMKYVDVRDPQDVFNNSAVPAFLKADPDVFRTLIINSSVAFGDLGRSGIEMVGIEDQSGLKRYAEYLAAVDDKTLSGTDFASVSVLANPALLDVMNVKYVITTERLENPRYKLELKDSVRYFAHNVEFHNEAYVYENTNYLPRSFVVPDAKVLESGSVLAELKSPSFDPKEYVVLEKPSGAKGGESFHPAKITLYSPDSVVVDVNLTSSGFLVLADSWYPGWEAYDNGKNVEIYRADYVFRAVYLGPGSHTVEFVYNPLSFKVGLAVSCLAALALLALAVKKRRSII